MKLRYYTENEILLRIDKCYANSLQALKEADGIEAQIKVLRMDPAATQGALDELREEQDKLRRYAENQIQKNARRLKDRLATMRTKLLSFAIRDANNLRASDMSVRR